MPSIRVQQWPVAGISQSRLFFSSIPGKTQSSAAEVCDSYYCLHFTFPLIMSHCAQASCSAKRLTAPRPGQPSRITEDHTLQSHDWVSLLLDAAECGLATAGAPLDL